VKLEENGSCIYVPFLDYLVEKRSQRKGRGELERKVEKEKKAHFFLKESVKTIT